MILPIAAVLLQISAIQLRPAIATLETETVRPASVDAGTRADESTARSSEGTASPESPSAPASRASRDSSPGSEPDDPISLAASPTPLAASPTPLAAYTPLPARPSLSESLLQPRPEKAPRRGWIALAIAQHSAAAFDAWSTNRALSAGNAQESNPMLRAFAGNPSIYAAIQVGPVLFDYVGRRMMTSRYGWARHTWWVLQAMSTATSIASGAHN